MQAASSADRSRPAADVGHTARRRAVDVPTRTRVAMVALGFIPALHVLSVLTPLALAATGGAAWSAAWLAPVLLFVAPPLVVRLVLWRWTPSGRVAMSSPAFLRWWCAAQCQVVFARLPVLEELMRLVPGLYSLWLRLWGARIGSLVYWSPGVTILDRSLVRVGSRVVFGVGVRLNPHVLAPGMRGEAVLYAAPISIGDDVLVGGYSLLLPGSVIADGEVTPPHRSIHAFSRFEGGRRIPMSSPMETMDC